MIETSLLEWITVGSLLLLSFAVLLLAIKFRRKEKLRDRLIAEIRADIAALGTGAAGVGQHIARLEQRLRRLDERHDRSALRQQADSLYREAVRLARGGASAEAIVANCGLVREEASLLVSLYGIDKAS